MRRILYLSAIALGLGTSASVLAQGGGGGGMGGGGGTGAGGGGSTFGGGSGGSGGSSFAGGSGGSSFAGGAGGNSFTGGGTQSFTGGTGGGSTGSGAGGRAGGGGTGTGTTFTPSTTGIFAAYYTNPLYPGRPGSTNLSNKTVGGFGQPSFGTTTTSTQRTTGQSGRTGTATASNQNQNRNQNMTPITYAMEVRFAAPAIVPARLQTDLQGLINRTSAIRTPGTVRIEVAGQTVILRGRVADDEERRVVEGMVRMEPGVRDVRNELTIP